MEIFSCSRRSKMLLISPTSGIVGPRFLPISAVSISIWMILTCCSRFSGLGTARSAILAPAMIRRSLFATARFAYGFPLFPSIPKYSGWFFGITPMPIIVVTSGILFFSQNWRTHASPFPRITPPPAQIRGFFALLIAATTLCICGLFPFVLGLYPRILTSDV